MWVDHDVLNEIVVAILKMATGRNFSMSGINSGHHNLPTFEMALKSDNVEFLRYCGGHLENGEQFLRVAIFKMATTISQNINIVRYHHNLICG
jgi:hypothetical protein